MFPICFVHKRIIGAATNFVSSGFNPLAAVGGFIAGGGGSGASGGQPTVQQRVANVFTGAAGVARFTGLARGDCPPGTRRFPDGHCHTRAVAVLQHPGDSQGALPGGDPFVSTGGTAMVPTNGGVGGMAPFVEQRIVRSCFAGWVLDKMGQCVPKKSISNKQRLYPRGTRPLGTPSEMAALRKAATFGRRMESTVKRMQKIGVLKKPGRRSAPRAGQRQIGPGGPSIINVE